jgi:hypothetical protein
MRRLGPLSIKAVPIAKLAFGTAFILRGPFFFIEIGLG